ncbi:MAG: hypothetical protein FJW26_12760 [Acidimicrobiia bacterium]|nr:hypothetical protein [Acidimicrobiia bacterium]
MGAVHFSVDTKVIEELKRHLPLSVLVETGTFEGDTVALARPYFDRVYTVESSEKYYQEARRRFEGDGAVQVVLGHSPQFLETLMPQLKGCSILFWLDAHWCAAEGTAGQVSECPLLDEIHAIRHLNETSVILVDDARLFFCPPPSPHEISGWLAFDDILKALKALSSRHRVMVLNDVMMFYPEELKQPLNQFAHVHNIDLLSAIEKSRQHDSLRLEYDKVVKEFRSFEAELKREIAGLVQICTDRLKLIEHQDAELEDRLKLIEHQDAEMRKMLRSTPYRIAYCLTNPITAARALFRRSVSAKGAQSE